MAGVVNLFSAATLAVLVLLATSELGLGPGGYGLLLTGGAVGGIAAGLVAAGLVRRLGPGPAILLSNLLPAVGYLVLAVSSHPLVTGSAFALSSFAATIGNVVVITLAIMAVALAPVLTTTALNAASGAHDDVRPRDRAGSDMGRRTT
jgi:Na+/melibiose symporter-like transporter